MKFYKVYFEIYGKKMVATVQAKDNLEAQRKVMAKIKFHKVVEEEWSDEMQDIMDTFDKFFKK